jgi:hypothetical protein
MSALPITLRPQCDVLDSFRSHNLIAASNASDALIKQLYSALIIANTSLDVPNKQQVITEALDAASRWGAK